MTTRILWYLCAKKRKAHKELPCKEENGENCMCDCHKCTCNIEDATYDIGHFKKCPLASTWEHGKK